MGGDGGGRAHNFQEEKELHEGEIFMAEEASDAAVMAEEASDAAPLYVLLLFFFTFSCFNFSSFRFSFNFLAYEFISLKNSLADRKSVV